jgi:hypothetical protein
MINTITKTLLLTVLLGGFITPTIRADETADLMQTILQASPTERAKAQKMTSSSSRKSYGAKKATASGGSSLVPNLGIPESQLLEVNSKFPKDFVGKYVYGPVSFKSISQEGNDVCITFTAKGYRGFNFYTKDPAVIQTFSQCGWGTKFNIPKECPLRILTKELFQYVVRLPFDQDTTTHTLGEQIQQGFQ